MAKKPTVIVPKLVEENLANDKLTALKNLFPEVMTEVKDDDGKIVYGIDVEKLAEAVSGKAVEKFETYGLNWIGKSQCIALSKEAPAGALRPCIEDSVNFNETENVYIEGDNLEVLKLLRSTYKGKIKMIYIDPPYNTGNDFIYKDNFKMPIEQYKLITGQKDEDGNKLTTEKETAGYRHSDWLNMMYPRLKIARELLTDDGVIFISIDDNEVSNLKKICDEIFGERNFVAQIPWQSRSSIQNDTDFSINHEYIIIYAKIRRQTKRRLKESNYKEWYKKDSFVCKPIPLNKNDFDNPDNDIRGIWKADPFDAPNIRENLTYKIINPTTKEEFLPPLGRCWRTEQSKYNELLLDNRIVFGKDGTSRPQLKVFYEEKKEFGSVDNSWFSSENIGTTSYGTKETMKLFNGLPIFDKPKPTTLLNKLLNLANLQDDSIILDFFSGSATTAHAVMQLNAEDGGNRKYIMVQLPAETPEKSEARKAGYSTICEIGKERIRKAGEKIKKDYPDANIDTGFRVFKLDSSNINEEIFKKPHETSVYKLIADKIKEDRTDLDLLTQVMLENSIELSMPIKEENIDEHKVYSVDNDYLIACFDTDIKEETFKKLLQKENVALIALKEPINDSFLTNVNVLKMQYNPNVEVRVLEYGI